MKAIIIEEHKFKELLELMVLKRDQQINSVTAPGAKNAINDMHGSWHYEFIRWAQKEGASCL